MVGSDDGSLLYLSGSNAVESRGVCWETAGTLEFTGDVQPGMSGKPCGEDQFLGSQLSACLCKACLKDGILVHQRFCTFEAVDDSGMVPSSKALTDFNELKCEELSAQIHGCLPGNRELLGAGFRAKTFGSDSPVACNDFLDALGCNGWNFGELAVLVATELVAQGFLSKGNGDVSFS